MAASSGIILPGQTASVTTTPASGAGTVYMDSTYNQPRWKDNAGVAHTFGGGAFLSVVDYGADPTGVADSTAAVVAAMAVAQSASGTASIIYFPQGTYLISGTITPSAYYFTFQGAGNPQTTIISTSQSADVFAVNQWYCTVKDMLITAPNTTLNQAGVTLTTTPQTLTVAAITTGQWLAAGSFQVGTTAGGWVTASYTGRTGTTFTGVTVASGSNALTTGAPIQLKTGGYAVNIASGVNYCTLDNAWMQSFYQGVNQSGATNQMRNLQIRNSSNIAINVNNTNSQPFLHNITTDNTPTNQPAGANLQVLTCGLLMISNCDFIHGGTTNALLNASGAGIFSVYVENTFFDTSSGIGLSITGSAVARAIKFTSCWFSSSTNGIVLNNTLCSGLNFTNCDVYANSGTAIVMTACGDWTMTSSRIASPSAGTLTGISLAGSPTSANVAITNCTIGAVGSFFSFATGISVAAGTYGTVSIQENNFSGNTTHLTDSSTAGAVFVAANTGLVVAPKTQAPALALPITTVTQAGVSVLFPANARVGTKVRITAELTNAASAQTLTPTLRFGTAGTNADASVAGLGLGAGTAAVGGGRVVAEFTIISATTCTASITTFNAAVAAAGLGTAGLTNLPVQTSMSGGATPGTAAIATTAASFLGLYFNTTVGAVVTVRSVEYEVLQQ